MKSDKTTLRAELKYARLELSDEEHRSKSQLIANRLKQTINWSDITTLHYFEPLHELLEVDTSGLITYLEDTYPKLQLSTSRLISGTWKVIGVHGGPPPAKFGAILVPMLGFDPKTLHRIGYGGGYYDKLLAAQPQAHKIGVCFESGKTANLPTGPHDISLDSIITEHASYS